MAQIFLTTSGNFSAPVDWPGQADKIECVGSGGNGAAGTTALGGGGGGGGEYATESGTLTLANGAAYTVGAAGGATLTSIVAGGITIAAHPGGNASGITAGAAGSGSTNTVHRNGGVGGTGSSAASRPGAGGGGAGGPVAAGAAGGNSAASNGFKGSGGGGDGSATSSAGVAGTSATAGGAGGAPDGGTGGNGLAAAGTATAGSASASSLDFDGFAHGVSGGGGGGGGNSGSSGTRNGGAGGAGGPTGGYGGGGGGGGSGATAGGAGGAAGAGLIVITYTPTGINRLGSTDLGNNGGAAGSWTVSCTVPTNANFVCFFVSGSDNTTSPGVQTLGTATYGGSTLSEAGSIPGWVSGGNGVRCSKFYYLKNPPTGANNLVVNQVGGGTDTYILAVAAYYINVVGVGAVTTVTSGITNETSQSAPSGNLSNAGSWVVAGCGPSTTNSLVNNRLTKVVNGAAFTLGFLFDSTAAAGATGVFANTYTFASVAFSAITVELQVVAPVPTAYYVNNSTGSDSNPGTSALPWASLTPVNAGVYNGGDTINFAGGQTFSGTATATPQSWSTSQKNASSTLSNSNLTASCNNATLGSYPGFAQISATNGKYYWEDVITLTGTNASVGIGNTASSTASGQYLGIGADTLAYLADGRIVSSNGALATYQTYTSGARICFALDLDFHMLWVRVGTTGNWNNNATNNPATNTGGIAIPSAVYASPVVPGYNLANNTIPDSVVASFSSASWSGTAPSGFVSMDTSATSALGITLTTANWGAAPAPTRASPVTFQSYGTGVATISSGGVSGFSATNLGGIAVSNLIFTGNNTNTVSGVLIQNTQAGNTTLAGPAINGLTVSGYSDWGILVLGNNGNSGFDTPTISNCIAHDNHHTGIDIASVTLASGTPCFTNSTISNCRAYNNGNNGLTIGQATTGTITNSLAYNNGASFNGSVGIIIYDCVNSVCSYCESYSNKTPGANDGDGFNIDSNTGGTALLEYCYSHDNDGFGALVDCYVGANTATIRYCIFENNCLNAAVPNTAEVACYVQSAGQSTALTMHNCTIYSTRSCAGFSTSQAITTLSGKICNNIFYATNGVFVSTPGAGPTVGNPPGLIFDGNDYYVAGGSFSLYWNGTTYTSLASWQSAYTNQEIHSGTFSTFNPLLVSPGGGGTVGGYAPPQPTAYALQPGSPMIGVGLNLNTLYSINPGTSDYYGNTIPHATGTGYNIGAYGALVAAAGAIVSQLAAAGNLAVGLLPQTFAGAPLAGTGAIAASVTDLAAAAATLGANSSLVENLIPQTLAGATLSASSVLSTTLAELEAAVAVLSAGGTLTSTAQPQTFAAAILAGTAAASTMIRDLAAAAASFSGSGAMSADAPPQTFAATSLSGVAALTSAIAELAALTTVLNAASNMSAGFGAGGPKPIAAILSAAAALATSLAELETATAALAGAGSLAVDVPPQTFTGASLLATGSIAATFAGAPGAIGAILAATASVLTAVQQLAATAASMVGAGSIVVDAPTQTFPSAALAGTGAVAISMAEWEASVAAFNAAGALTADTRPQTFAATALPAAGTISSAISDLLAAGLVLPGSGILTALVQPQVPAQISLSAVGALNAAILELLPSGTALVAAGILTPSLTALLPSALSMPANATLIGNVFAFTPGFDQIYASLAANSSISFALLEAAALGQPLVGSASLVSPLFAQLPIGGNTLAGAGAIASAVLERLVGSFVAGGAGSLNIAPPFELLPIGVAAAASGMLVASVPLDWLAIGLPLSATGIIAIDVSKPGGFSFSAAGASALSLSPLLERLAIGAAAAGAGMLVALPPQERLPLAAALAGIGQIAIDVSKPGALSQTLPAQGVLSAAAALDILISSPALSGSGYISVDAPVGRGLTAALSGSGLLSSGLLLVPKWAVLSADSTLIAAPNLIPIITAALAGSSALVFTPNLIPLLVELLLAAGSAISVDMHVLLGKKIYALEAALHGAGGLHANLHTRSGHHREIFTTVGLPAPGPPTPRNPIIVDRIKVP